MDFHVPILFFHCQRFTASFVTRPYLLRGCEHFRPEILRQWVLPLGLTLT